MGREVRVVGTGAGPSCTRTIPAQPTPADPSRPVQTGPASSDLLRCLDFLADALTGPPDLAALERAARAARDWPLTDAESRRGTGLLVESALAGESPERLQRDHDRLFVSRVHAVVAGHAVRISTPVASPLAGDLLSPAPAGVAAVAALRAAYAELGLPASPQPDHLAVVLDALAHLLRTTTPPPVTARLRRELVEDHLHRWGTCCLGRMQRGAQTFYYQGVAALGLATVRAAVQLTSRTTLP